MTVVTKALRADDDQIANVSPQLRCLDKLITLSTILWIVYILHYLKDPKLWEIRYIPRYGSCRIYIISRIDP